MKSIPLWNPVNIKDIPGTYTIEGINQDAERTKYNGVLKLLLNENNRIVAHWSISNNSQIMKGLGFYKDNILVINFQYEGNDSNVYKGVVVYSVISKDILNGFWSEKHGNQDFLGEEQCIKATTISSSSLN